MNASRIRPTKPTSICYFSLGSRERVDALTRRLREAGYPTLSGLRVTGDGCCESGVAGVEGNRVELTV